MAFTPGHTGGAAVALLADERIAAALASRLAAGADVHAAVVYAVAVGSASVESPVAGGLDVARAGALAAQVAGAAAP